MKEQEIFEGKRASEYDDNIGFGVPGYSEMHNKILDVTLNKLNTDTSQNILSLGCGTGKEIEMLLPHSKNWNIYGYDPSPQMIKQAERKFYPTYQDRIHLFRGSINEVPQNDFSIIFSILVMHFLSDDGAKETYLKGIYKRLLPGGILILADLFGTRESMDKKLSELHKNLLFNKKLTEKQIEKGIYHIMHEVNWVSENRMMELFESVGFQSVRMIYQEFYTGCWACIK